MDEKNVKKAITILYDMEINNYKMTRTIARLNYEISCLGHRAEIFEPQEPSYPRYHREENGCLCTVLGGIIGIIFGMIIGVLSENILVALILTLFIGPLVGGGLASIIEWGVHENEREKSEQEEYERRLHTYETAQRNYLREIKLDEERVRQELRQKTILMTQRDLLRERLAVSERILARFYIKIGIKEMFRSLIPIGKMYEIVTLDITSRLEGENGLYDRVRRELREDAFYLKLEEISTRLDMLISQQDRLYREILNLNSQCEDLVNAAKQSACVAANNNELLKETVHNTSIAAYNSERIAAEERYQSFMLTYRF